MVRPVRIGTWNMDGKGAGRHVAWNGAGAHWDGPERDTASRTQSVLSALDPVLRSGGERLVFGGDFNHDLEGPVQVGSTGGRTAILALADELGLQVPTVGPPHRQHGLLAIDHVAVPTSTSQSERQEHLHDHRVQASTKVSPVHLSDASDTSDTCLHSRSPRDRFTALQCPTLISPIRS